MKGIRPVKNGGWWRWALLSLDGMAPSQMVGVSASVSLLLHHKVQSFSSGTSSPRWCQKKGCKTVVVVVVFCAFAVVMLVGHQEGHRSCKVSTLTSPQKLESNFQEIQPHLL